MAVNQRPRRFTSGSGPGKIKEAGWPIGRRGWPAREIELFPIIQLSLPSCYLLVTRMQEMRTFLAKMRTIGPATSLGHGVTPRRTDATRSASLAPGMAGHRSPPRRAPAAILVALGGRLSQVYVQGLRLEGGPCGGLPLSSPQLLA